MAAASFSEIGEMLTKALLECDFALYRNVMQLPLRIEPRAGEPYEVTTEAELEQDMTLYHNALKINRVTDLIREIRQIRTDNDRQLTVTYRVHIMSGANHVVEPFESAATLYRTGAQWRIGKIISTLGHINWTRGRADITEAGKFSSPESAPDDTNT